MTTPAFRYACVMNLFFLTRYCIYFILLLMMMMIMMIDWSIMNAMALGSSSLVLSIIDATLGLQDGGDGGGISASGSSTITMTNCQISGNTASSVRFTIFWEANELLFWKRISIPNGPVVLVVCVSDVFYLTQCWIYLTTCAHFNFGRISTTFADDDDNDDGLVDYEC